MRASCLVGSRKDVGSFGVNWDFDGLGVGSTLGLVTIEELPVIGLTTDFVGIAVVVCCGGGVTGTSNAEIGVE